MQRSVSKLEPDVVFKLKNKYRTRAEAPGWCGRSAAIADMAAPKSIWEKASSTGAVCRRGDQGADEAKSGIITLIFNCELIKCN
jgi:hypothetical protein